MNEKLPSMLRVKDKKNLKTSPEQYRPRSYDKEVTILLLVIDL